MGNMRKASSRFICNQQEQQTTTVCVSNARPRSLGSECHDIQMDKSVSICNMIQEVLMKLVLDESEMILIAPKWDTRSWYPHLLDRSIEQPIPLKGDNLLVQSHSGILCNNLPMWNLHAWRLSGKAPKNKGSVNQ